jgi:PAS domain S-box-containing protein
MNEMGDREKQRLAELARYDMMDTPREPSFDELAELAAKLCEVPIAVVNLIGDGRQFFKAEVGLGVRETPLETSFCAKAILEDEFLLVPDATQDPRFDCNPLVVGEPHIRFYAGALLKTEHGHPIGTLCVLDYRPRELTKLQQETLRVLARQVMAQLELRRAVEERGRRFEAAAASEQRLRLILDSARDYAIISTDEKRRITSWSAGAQATFEWSEQEAIGRLIDDIFTPEDRAADVPEQEASRALAEGCAPDVRWHLRADGSRVFMNGSTHPIIAEGNRPAGFLKIARNETAQRKQAEELARTRAELLESEARFRSMADSTPMMMWVTDSGGLCTYLNRSWYEFTGQEAEEALGSGWLNAIHPEDKPEAERAFFQANTAQAPFRTEYRLRRRDGSYRWAIDAASPRFGADGSYLGYVGSVIDIDERREAEDALRRANALLEAVMEAVPGVVYAKDREGRMVAANRGTTELVGKPLPEIIGRTDKEFLDDPAQAQAVMANDTRVMMGNRTEVLEEDVSFPDGRCATWLSTKAPFRDAQGAVVGLVGSSLDITERKAAEERLRDSEARLLQERTRLATLVESLPVGICFLTPAGEVLLSNPAYRQFVTTETLPSRLPDTNQEWIGWNEHGQPLSRDQYPGSRALRGETTRGIEFLHRTDAGKETWIRVSGVPLVGTSGEMSAAIIVLIDITEQKRAQDALRRLNESLEAQVEERTADRDRMWRLSTDLMLVARFDATITAVNPAWTSLLGWSEAELIGRSFLDLVHPEDRESTVAEAGRLSEGLTTLRFENRYQHKDGSYRCLSWTAVPDENFIHAVARDVDAEKKAQIELEQTQEQLRQAQKMETVGQLTGGIAHDFNNLLTGVIGSLDMMQRRIARGETDNIERYATAAITSANRAAALTHRLLAFSRRQPLDPKPTNANRLVTGMEELLRRTIGEAVRLEIVTAGGLWQTLCDPHQLESAVLNLAINARDAMPEGGTLTIETCNAHLDAYAARQREVKPGQYVCICVTDTGVGMTADTIQKAFEPFFTTKPIGQGTGLGLSMIYGFARQSEGYAKIYSEVGRGTTFKLYLPRYYGEGQEGEDQPIELGEEHRAEHGEVVLVVEDETAVRALVVDVLQELGYHALEAVDGPSGLKLLQSNRRIDLLITDIGLPGLNGRQLADAARERRPDLKVLFMTGYAENATIANGFLDPGMEMMTKPFAIEMMATRIRAIIEAQRS